MQKNWKILQRWKLSSMELIKYGDYQVKGSGKHMKKTGISRITGQFLMCLLLSFCILAIPVCAQGNSSVSSDTGAESDQNHPARLVDGAGLLSEEEGQKLGAQLDEISTRQQCDVVIVTVSSLDGRSASAYADDYYDYNGYGMGSGDDGILFLIAMSERKWAISTYGFGITAFTDAGQEYIIDQLHSDLSEGNYYDAFETFARQADDFLTQAENGEAYDTGHLPVTAADVGMCIVVGLIAGFILALVRVFIMKSQMKTVYSRAAASGYLLNDSIHFQEHSDHLVRKTVNKVYVKPKESSGGGSSVHTSSSGRSHGGSSGSF